MVRWLWSCAAVVLLCPGLALEAPKCCLPAPPLPGAALIHVDDTGTCDAVAHYRCLEGHATVDGPTSETLLLQCSDGHYDYAQVAQVGCAPVGVDEAHCWNATCIRGPARCQLEEAWMVASLDVSDCADGKGGGESCVVRCAEGYFQASQDRYAKQLPHSDQVPVLLVCQEGVFKGPLVPPACVKPEDEVLEFDVYAVLREDPDSGDLLYPSGEPVGKMPSNLDVHDLEGLLAHLYTAVHAGQQDLAEIKELYRKETGEYILRYDSGVTVDYTPTLPAYRDNVNTVVWYRLKMKAPPKLNPKTATNYEFGTYASFQFGKATNEAAFSEFRRNGGLVGLSRQRRGLNRQYIVSPEGQKEGKNVKNCNKEQFRSRYPTLCMEAFNPLSDPRYAPSGRFNSFSLPGRCPDKTFKEKNRTNDADCLQMDDGTPVLGGLCDRLPDGSPSCTYSLQEVARISLDSITGVTSQSCGWFRSCKDLRDFQFNCRDQKLRQGVKIDGTERRECVEYAMPRWDCDRKDKCWTATWECLSNCSPGSEAGDDVAVFRVDGDHVQCHRQVEGEATLPFFARRCDDRANERRLAQLSRAFVQAAASQRPSNVAIVQDCGRYTRPDRDLGLGYSERDETGVCSNCFIPGTRKFNPKRAIGETACRADLFLSGGYSAGKGRGSPRCGRGERGLECNKYLLHVRVDNPSELGWQYEGEWSTCSVTCGQGYRLRTATCPRSNVLGDCRRELGPPEHGFCDKTGCYSVENCEGQACPWLPFCDHAAIAEGRPCLSGAWGPVQGSCAAGQRNRYRRCWYFAAGADSNTYCANVKPPGEVVQGVLIGQRSRLQNCAVCGATGSCLRCAASGLFEADGPSSCMNQAPFVQIGLSLAVSSHWRQEPFQQTSFWQLSGLFTPELSQSKAWPRGTKAYLLDVFRHVPKSTSTTATASTTIQTGTHTPTTTANQDTTIPEGTGSTTTAAEATITPTTTTRRTDRTMSTTTTWDVTTTTFKATSVTETTKATSVTETTKATSVTDTTSSMTTSFTTSTASATDPVLLNSLSKTATQVVKGHWMFIIAVGVDAAQSEAEVLDSARRGAQDLASNLEKALKAERGPRACGECRVTVYEEPKAFCPKMQPWDDCHPAGHSWQFLAGCVAIILGLFTLLVLAVVLYARFGRARCCPGPHQIELQDRP